MVVECIALMDNRTRLGGVNMRAGPKFKCDRLVYDMVAPRASLDGKHKIYRLTPNPFFLCFWTSIVDKIICPDWSMQHARGVHRVATGPRKTALALMCRRANV